MEDVDKLYMKRIHISDYYDDDNEGYIFGIHFFDEYTPEDLGQMMAIEAEWFETEAEREEAIKSYELAYNYVDID